MSETARQPLPGACLLHPVFLVALAVLVFNDHHWKGVGPPLVTGKLSDVAVMVLLPLVIQAGAEWWLWLRGRAAESRAALWVGLLIAAGIMASINVFEPAATAYRWGLGALQWPAQAVWGLLRDGQVGPLRPVSLVMDAADLWTIPAGGVALWVDRSVRG